MFSNSQEHALVLYHTLYLLRKYLKHLFKHYLLSYSFFSTLTLYRVAGSLGPISGDLGIQPPPPPPPMHTQRHTHCAIVETPNQINFRVLFRHGQIRPTKHTPYMQSPCAQTRRQDPNPQPWRYKLTVLATTPPCCKLFRHFRNPLMKAYFICE